LTYILRMYWITVLLNILGQCLCDMPGEFLLSALSNWDLCDQYLYLA